ncbi:hypothetical protein Syun_020676 [Stephania yunnanensis]|uniref:Cation-transporting P-type ATPase N-terminal domain-containing protein n=1 Tax=Stephania yunnanensis TaxID=152371 RepID=A0AAP0IE76_9MAGN
MDENKSIALEAVGREVVNVVIIHTFNWDEHFFLAIYDWWFIYNFVRYLFQENIPIEGVFENLKCTREGLRSNEVKERLQLFGYNKLEEKKDISGNYTMRSSYHEVVKLQGVAQSLNKDCVSRMKPSQAGARVRVVGGENAQGYCGGIYSKPLRGPHLGSFDGTGVPSKRSGPLQYSLGHTPSRTNVKARSHIAEIKSSRRPMCDHTQEVLGHE